MCRDGWRYYLSVNGAVIAVSAGIRDVLFVTLIFLQCALIVIGYFLEVLQHDYAVWSKYRFMANQIDDDFNTKIKLSKEDENTSEKTNLISDQLVLDDFLDVISNNTESQFDISGNIANLSASKRFIINCLYFLAFTFYM